MNRTQVLLAAQMALLGEVFPLLDEVDISWEPGAIHLRFFLSANPTDEDKDSMSVIETEMYAHFPNEKISYEYKVGKANTFERGEACIFARRPNYNDAQ